MLSPEIHDPDIDLREMPEVGDWSDARRGGFYRPIKKQLTLRARRGCLCVVQSARGRWREVSNDHKPCLSGTG